MRSEHREIPGHSQRERRCHDVNPVLRNLRRPSCGFASCLYALTQHSTLVLVHHFHLLQYSLTQVSPPSQRTAISQLRGLLANESSRYSLQPAMMASPFHPPQLVASGSTYSPLDSPYSSFSSPRFEHPQSPASSAPSSSSSAAWAPSQQQRPCFHSNGSVYSDISSNEDFDFSDPTPLSSLPSPAMAAPAPKLNSTKPQTPLASTSRPILPTGSDSVLSNLSPSETLDFSDPAAEAAAASRAALPTPPAAPATRRPIQRLSPDGYPFPWVLSRPATPPTLLPPSSAFSTPSSSGQNTPASGPSHSPYINDVEAQTTLVTSREINSYGSRPLPDTPAAEIPTTPAEHVQSRGRYAGSTPGCTGPLPMVSHEDDKEEDGGGGIEATPRQNLRKRKSANALLAARMIGGLSSAGVTYTQPAVASPLREVVE